MNTKPYPQYKNSGTEWIGFLPAGWTVRKLKHIASIQFSSVDKHTLDGEDIVRLCNYVDVYKNDFIDEQLELMTASASRSEIAQFRLRKGDVLVTKDSEDWRDIAVPAFVDSDFNDVLCGYHLAQIRANDKLADGKFLFRAISARGINDQFRVLSNGITRFGLSKYGIDNGIFPLPPIDEQRTIAAFLDRETARIDGLVAKKQRQIALLQEKRVAVISHAVTKSLDPNAKMKPSGVDWLGDVPEHWETIRFKFLLELPLEYGANESAEFDDPSLPRFIRITDIDESGNLRTDTFKSLPFDVARPFLLKHGDLLFARSGATVGKTIMYREEWGLAAFAGYLIRARVNVRRILPSFATYYCQTSHYWDWLQNSYIQSTIQNVNAERYANMFLPLPTVEEQNAIVDYLNRETAHIDTMTAKIKQSIETLKEYRIALISAAVTGKIDVRRNPIECENVN